MKPRKYISLIADIKDAAHKFIVDELKARDIEGIVPSHGAILHELFRNSSLPMSEIALRIRRRQPTVTVLVDKLVAQGYAVKEKDPYDSRVFNVSITQKGRDLRARVDEVSKALFMKLGMGLSGKELDTLEEILGRIHKNC